MRGAHGCGPDRVLTDAELRRIRQALVDGVPKQDVQARFNVGEGKLRALAREWGLLFDKKRSAV